MLSPVLSFCFGPMNCGKTADLVRKYYDLQEKGQKVFAMKPKIDTRNGDKITSRMLSLAIDAFLIENQEGDVHLPIPGYVDAVFVDEVHFLEENMIDYLREVATTIPVYCFGLLRGESGKLFPSSKRLFEVCDVLIEKHSFCEMCCEETATMTHKRFKTKEFVGGNEMYMVLCWRCWKIRTG